MHVVNSLEAARAVLQRAQSQQLGINGATGAGGKPSPLAGEGLDEGASKFDAHSSRPLTPRFARPSPARGEGCAATPLQLISPPFAACHAGVNYYRKLLDQLRGEFPAVEFSFTLCCGDDPAIAHDALRMGFASVVCECSDGMFVQLQAAAETVRAAVLREFPEAVIPAQAGIHAEQCA